MCAQFKMTIYKTIFYADCVNICKNNVIYGRTSNKLLNIYKYLFMCLDILIR